MRYKLIPAPIPDINAFSTVFQGLLPSIAGVVTAAPGTLNKGTEQIRLTIARSTVSACGNLPDFVKLLRGNIRFAVA